MSNEIVTEMARVTYTDSQGTWSDVDGEVGHTSMNSASNRGRLSRQVIPDLGFAQTPVGKRLPIILAGLDRRALNL